MSIVTSHSLANELLTVIKNKTCYLALLRAMPDKNGSGGQECSGGGYARKSITFTVPANSVMQNTARIEFNMATASWGTVAAYGVYNASGGGTLLWAGQLDQTINVAQGTKFAVAAGGIQISLGID